MKRYRYRQIRSGKLRTGPLRRTVWQSIEPITSAGVRYPRIGNLVCLIFPGLSAKFRKQVFQMFLMRQRVRHPRRILRGRTVARPQHRERSFPPRRNTVLARRARRRLTRRAFVSRVPLRGVLQYPPRRNLVFQSLHRLTNLSHGILAPPSDGEKHAVNKHFR